MSDDIFRGWITTRQAADQSGYGEEYIRSLARKGRLRTRKVGTTWLIAQDSLVAYKAKMDRMGKAKYNPWRSDLVAQRRGRQGPSGTPDEYGDGRSKTEEK